MENKNTKQSKLNLNPMALTIIPIGICFLQALVWFILSGNAFVHDQGSGTALFLVAVTWLTLGILICAMLISKLTKRGAFSRMVVRSDSIALAGELNLFLGIVVFIFRLNARLYGAGLFIEFLLLGAFIAIGTFIFGLACIKAGEFTENQVGMARGVAVLNGFLAFLGTVIMAASLLIQYHE